MWYKFFEQQLKCPRMDFHTGDGMGEALDTDQFALDFLHASREVAAAPEELALLMQRVLDVNDSDSNFSQLIKAVVRLRFLETAIMDAISDLPNMGTSEAGKLYQDLSRAAVLVGVARDGAQGHKLVRYFPHLLSREDLERSHTVAEFGRGKEDVVKAIELLDNIQVRLHAQRNT
ncbi:MAG: hypothetical protein MUP21_05270 [Dehalococcoidia bacterium]|nr:hypothetical protein [Dehalococcoidia bacterium]